MLTEILETDLGKGLQTTRNGPESPYKDMVVAKQIKLSADSDLHQIICTKIEQYMAEMAASSLPYVSKRFKIDGLRILIGITVYLGKFNNLEEVMQTVHGNPAEFLDETLTGNIEYSLNSGHFDYLHIMVAFEPRGGSIGLGHYLITFSPDSKAKNPTPILAVRIDQLENLWP